MKTKKQIKKIKKRIVALNAQLLKLSQSDIQSAKARLSKVCDTDTTGASISQERAKKHADRIEANNPTMDKTVEDYRASNCAEEQEYYKDYLENSIKEEFKKNQPHTRHIPLHDRKQSSLEMPQSE